MAEAIQPVERGAVMVISAGTVENVADVNDPAQIVRVHVPQEQPEPPLLPPVVRRVAEGGEREGPQRICYRRGNTPSGPEGRCNHCDTRDD